MTKLTLKLMQLPYFSMDNNGNTIYEATAKDTEENMYSIYWDLAEDFDPSTDEDETSAANWNNPTSVYNHETSKEIDTTSIVIDWNN